MPTIPLKLDDILVEIRNKNLTRMGAIPAPDLDLKIQPVFNGVGAWSVTLPAEHPKVPMLRAPGAGILVTNLVNGETILSGSTSKPTRKASSEDPKGTLTVSGLDDNRLLWDARAFPDAQGSADPGAQTRANDVRTGNAESLMRAYTAYNIAGSHAPAGRHPSGSLRDRIRLEGTNKGLGATLTKRPRFQNLGELLLEISAESGLNLGFRMVQVGDIIEFQVYQPQDRSKFIRLDVANGTLSDQSVEFAPPEVTRSIVAGQGEGTDRKIIQVQTTDSIAAEAEWGLVIEEFMDQRQTNDTAELTSAATGDLAERGFTKVAVKATPANDQTMVFMRDFFLGDKVSVVIDEQEPNSYITEAAIVINQSGIQTAVAVGDIRDFDSDSALRQTTADNTRRIDALERNSEQGEAPAPPDLSQYLKLGQTVVGSSRTSSGTPYIELLGNTGDQATIHLSSGSGFTGPYLFGLGNDFGSSPGFLIANKASGPGLYLDNHPTATNVAVIGFQRSNAAFMDLVAAKGGAGALVMLRLNGGVTPGADQRLLTTYGAAGEIFAVGANGKAGFFGRITERGAQIGWVDGSTPNGGTINAIIATLINLGVIYPN